MNFITDVLKALIVVSLACLFSACDDGRIHVVSEEEIVDLPDFIYVRSAGHSVVLGKPESSAPLKERTEMTVEFTYNYYLGKHEVTCTDYNMMVARTGPYSPCEADGHPAVLLNFNDVVLYANALSKRKKLDTAYTYYSAKFDEDGHCIELEGLKFRPEVDAFRLPTEAEWVYAAQQGWNTHNAWTSEVSDYYVKTVCVQPRNFLGFCDMSGNVMEWVGDWLGYFRDTTVTNYIGATDGGQFGEKVLKGGSVVNSSKNISYLSRLDVYPVNTNSKANYVGFRLAFGRIPDPSTLSFDGSASLGNVSPVASATTVKSYTGSFSTKLAFRNAATGNLAYMDYSLGSLSVKEIADTMDVYHPEISPNGRWVAFCTTMEGLGGKSEVYVRKLNENGDGLVKLDVESAAIPRWRVLPSGDTVIVYVNDAVDNSLSSFETNNTWQVPFANGRFGEPEKLFDGAYHDGISSDNTLAVSGSTKLRARVAAKQSTVTESANDEIWYNEDQACNVSLSKGSSKQTLFLDFSGKTGREFVGSRYAVHQYLFVADSSGKITRAVRAPKGYTFDHSEWIVGDTSKVDDQSGVAVATLTNNDGAHTKIVLLDTKDSSYATLVEGDELWHPCIWVKQNVADYENILLATDSAGMYYDIIAETSERIMKVKMRMFWDMKDSFELFAVGTSRTERGFDPSVVSSYKSFNFGYSGGELWGELYLAKNYILNHAKNLKVLVMEMPLDLQSNSPNFMNTTVFETAPGYFYDRNHDFWKEGLPEYFMTLVDENLPYSEEDEEKYVETMGFLRTESGSWRGNEISRDSNLTTKERGYYDAVMDSLDAFIKFTAQKNIKLVLAFFPQAPSYAETGSFGRHGVPRSLAMKTIAHYEEMTKKYPHVVLMDENKMGHHEYTDEMALDYDHLCEVGAKHFSEKLDSLLKAWE